MHPCPGLGVDDGERRLRRIQTQSGREAHHFAGPENMDASQDLVNHLHVAARTHAAWDEVQLVGVGHLLQEKFALFQGRVGCAGHDGERTIGGSFGTTGDWAVDEVDVITAPVLELLSDRLRI